MTTQATSMRADRASAGGRATYRAALPVVRFLFSLVLLLAIWMLFAQWKNVPLLFPGPTEVFESLKQLLATGELLEYTAVSLARILFGLILGSIGGVLLGLVLGSSR